MSTDTVGCILNTQNHLRLATLSSALDLGNHAGKSDKQNGQQKKKRIINVKSAKKVKEETSAFKNKRGGESMGKTMSLTKSLSCCLCKVQDELANDFVKLLSCFD